ncbi:MAG: DUF4167 domain-containing protein, partial [Pseudomonadota bacterium]
MRSSQKSNRNRGKNNRSKSLGNVANRVFDSAGPEGKVRGTPQQIIDKYEQLARDAQTSGDRVMSENFLQHAEHYARLLSAAQAEMQAHQAQHQPQQGGGGQPGQGQQPQPQGASQGQPQPNGHAGANGAGDAPAGGAPNGAAAPQGGGLDMIDPADGDGPALVATPEAPAAPQPG